MKRIELKTAWSALLLTVAMFLIQPPNAGSESSSPVGPRSVTVLIGGGQDTAVLDGYFPQNLRVRVGDTITWKSHGDINGDRHTVTFIGGPFPGPKEPLPTAGPGEVMPRRNISVPGGREGENMRNPLILFPTRESGAPIENYEGSTFATSGEVSLRPRKGTPRIETFSLTFTKPGTYRYYCLNHHPHMTGTIEVVAASATDVPDQAQIDAQAKTEMDALLAHIERANEQAKAVRSQPGPTGNTIWYVAAGAFLSSEMRGMSFDFHPKNLTVKAGDTVIWDAKDVHTVTFAPSPPIPETLIVKPQAEGMPYLIVNPQINQPSVPSGTYDPSQYYNSAQIGIRQARGTTWAMTFDKPGVYEYVCALHYERGMKAAVTVVAREVGTH